MVKFIKNVGLTQLGECLVYTQNVGGSNPSSDKQGSVVQWIRTGGFYPSGRRFESCRSRQLLTQVNKCVSIE